MKPEPTAEQIRATVGELTAKSGESLAALSRMLRRDDSYLQRFVKHGVPSRLSDKDRSMLARYFGIHERELGGHGPYPGKVALRKR